MIEITRSGYTEPLKHKVDGNSLEPLRELFDYYLSALFKGIKKFWLSGGYWAEGDVILGGGIIKKRK